MRRLRTPALSFLASCALLGGPMAAAATKPPDYSRMVVKVGKKSAEATLGTYCHPDSDGSGRCEDATFPLKTTGRVSIRANGTVELLLGAGAAAISWRAARVDANGKEVITALGDARSVTRTYKRWRFKLPKRLSKNSTLLGFNVNYPYAYSSFEVGAKVLRPKR